MELEVNSGMYPKNAIIEACYRYLDTAYLYLEKGKPGSIKIFIKSKAKRTPKELEKIKDDFLNDLLYLTIRHIVHNNNKKITENIVKRALFPAVVSESKKVELLDKYMSKGVEGKAPINDPLGIAVPWEEKFGNKKSRTSVKTSRKRC